MATGIWLCDLDDLTLRTQWPALVTSGTFEVSSEGWSRTSGAGLEDCWQTGEEQSLIRTSWKGERRVAGYKCAASPEYSVPRHNQTVDITNHWLRTRL